MARRAMRRQEVGKALRKLVMLFYGLFLKYILEHVVRHEGVQAFAFSVS